MDVQENALISRQILIRYQGEEASMRDSCSWRIEVPFESISDVSLVFTVDLYTHKPATANSFLIKAQEGTVIFCNYLNENVATSSSDKNRNMISSYKIFSITSATDLFLPTQYWTDNGRIQ